MGEETKRLSRAIRGVSEFVMLPGVILTWCMIALSVLSIAQTLGQYCLVVSCTEKKMPVLGGDVSYTEAFH